MKKIFAKCKCLVSGFPAVKGIYKISNFKLCYLKIDIEKMVKNDVMKEFNLNGFLLFCQYVLEDNCHYVNYFENIDFIPVEITDDDYEKIKKREFINIKQYDCLLNEIKTLERKIKLELNIPIAIHVACVELFDENYNLTNFYNLLFDKPFWFRLNEVDNSFNNNSRFHLNFDLVNELDNERIKRALDFFYDSFDSSKIEIRYVLLFTSLESLFNLDGKDISKNISNYVAKIMTLFDVEKYDIIFSNMKNLYNIRSKYIHGNSGANITAENEKELREIVRKVLIFYYLIYTKKKFSNKEMLSYLNNIEKIELDERLVLKTLQAKDFAEQQLGLIEELEKNIILPNSFKKQIYDGIDNYNKVA